ncbi:hypothetical protein G6L63_07725 [Agrobacterium vitis]|uniref:Uncharacterized protein n=1 Tax=Agrobacterium vitis TaxID=373 RepID=A0A368NUU0_AGRVI|nr:hypothetical protein [Agrobacterium vitis]KAA3516155.1 hypothetical protein DXM22_11995 [Agrobacterium vitis]KAA3525778.1 hypothetical protein DXT89_17110 [Agrobacterium vitis]MCF1478787.1 hypothetical protein [Agrobacterium vitis]MUZ95483.1 hypothetical protein [Agrobacterium vitis]MVA31742.1 hypothetical protein [Agrobacterium vitis]
MRLLFLPAVVAAMTVSSLSLAAAPASWPDTPVSRLQALAVLQTLNADLLSHDSATLTLDRWCSTHKLADGAKIIAERVKDVDKPATGEIRAALKVADGDKVGYRRVRLKCGDRILSEADNWYVPARLTDDMNKVLDTTDGAFGRVVQPLHFQRHTISAELLWKPLPEGWEMGSSVPPASGNPLSVPDYVLQHKALLSVPDGTPISMVVETYRRDLLDFTPPKFDTN